MVSHSGHDKTAVHRPGAVALALLVLSAVAHYGYKLAPLWAQPDAQNIGTAVAFIALTLWLAWRVPGWPVIGACAAWVAEELLRAGCSIAYIYRGAPATEPGDQCTGLIGLDLNRLGVFVIAILLVSICKKYQVHK